MLFRIDSPMMSKGITMLMIGNDIVKQVLTMQDCISAQEHAFAGLLEGRAVLRPRSDTYVPCAREDAYYRFGSVEGASDGVMAVRLKSDILTWPQSANGKRSEQKHCVQPGTWCGLVFLFSTANGEPLCILNDGHLQQMRVGGAAGIGTRLLAREDARVLGMIGSGGMARTFLRAICSVRDITTVKVYSRSSEHREAYAQEMSAALEVDVMAVDTAREAAHGADVLCTCTDSLYPTIEPDWLEPGMHVVNLGPREISPQTAARFDVFVRQGAEELEMAESQTFRKDIGSGAGAYITGTAEEQRRIPTIGKKPEMAHWPIYTDVISGKAPGRTSADQITHYRTIGNWGVQFSSVGALVYRKAKAAGLGIELPTEWFLQDIRN
jgi:ornithine cyclodeaminase/alanine dehydrogenase-like protein (mu-crystallin family)